MVSAEPKVSHFQTPRQDPRLQCDRSSCPCRKTPLSGWASRHCPVHDDRHPSLRVFLQDGRIVRAVCLAGCDRRTVRTALGLNGQAPDRPRRKPVPEGMIPNGPGEWLCRHLNLNWQDIRDLAAHYGLRGLKGPRKNDDGQDAPAIAFTWSGLDGRKVRIFPKTFQWEGTARPVLWPSLGLIRDAFPDADGIVLTEGEFDALILLHLGVPAVSVTGGADTPIPVGLGRELIQAGFRKVLILADADKPGIEAGRKWERVLREDGLAVKITTVVELGLGRASYGEKDVRDAWLSRTDLDEAAFVKPILEALEGGSTERATDEGVNVLDVGLLRAEDLNGHESAGPTWLVEPVLPDGSVVLLAGKYDSLKTWTAFHVAKQVLETTDKPVVYLDYDMMPIAVVRERLRATGLDQYVGGRLRFHSGPDMTALTATERWGEVVEALLALPPGLLVIDSLKAWLLNVKLNSDSDVLPYLQGLLRLRSAGWTVLVIHHVPKTGDGDFKNTGSIGDAVDVIWRGRREGAILKLEARKRRIDVPNAIGLDMTDPAHPTLLDADVAERRAREARIKAFLRENPDSTGQEIAEGTGIPIGTLNRLLPDMVRRGELHVKGSGKRGDPLRYSLPLPPDGGPPRKSSSDAVMRNGEPQDSRSDAKNPGVAFLITGNAIEEGGDEKPGPGKNDVLELTSGPQNFPSPHQTYNSEGSPGDGPVMTEGKGTRPDPLRYYPNTGDGPPQESRNDAGVRIDGAEESAPDLEKSPTGDSYPADHIGKGGGMNPESGKNHVMSPNSEDEQFIPPHHYVISEGSPGDGPDGQDLDPADPGDGPKIEPSGLNSQSLIDDTEGRGDTSDYPQAPGPPRNGPQTIDPEAAGLCADCWGRGIIRFGYLIGRDGVRRCGVCASVAVIHA